MSITEKPCRIVFLGSGRVGKTCIIQRLLKLPFIEKYQATIEDIYIRDIEKTNDKIQLKVEILDTSGSFHFAGMLALSISQATAIVLVFSLDDQHSLEYIKNLYNQIESQRDDFKTIPICIVCNKIDKNSLESISTEDVISSFKNEFNIELNQIVFASAKLNENIGEIFNSLWNQNVLKKTVNIPLPKESSNWSILIRRRVSALEAMTSSNSNIQKQAVPNSMMRTKSLCQNSQNSVKEIQKLNMHTKSLFKRSSTTSSKEWKKGDVLKIDCSIS